MYRSGRLYLHSEAGLGSQPDNFGDGGKKMNGHERLPENLEIVYEEVPLLEESKNESLKNRQLLCDNIEIIVENTEFIIKTPKYFHIRHKWFHVGSNWVGEKYIPLGVLLLLWQQGLFIG